MPELPDVEILRRYVDATSLNRRIERARVRDESILEGVSRQKLASALVGERLRIARRHGKLLGIGTGDDGWLLLHFGMTGSLHAWERPVGEPEHSVLRLDFDGGSHLACTSERRLGRIRWASDFDEFIEAEQLGPDALAVDLEAFRARVGENRGGIKALLMNQRVIAGVGNVYADEILFQARVAPDRDVGELSRDEVAEIQRALRHVVTTAIERGADPRRMPDSWLLPRREDGAACPRCGGTIRRSTVTGRSTFSCPGCRR